MMIGSVGSTAELKAALRIPISADQIFVEIPARSFEWTLRSSPLVERVRVLAFDRYLLGYRKRDVILAPCGSVDIA